MRKSLIFISLILSCANVFSQSAKLPEQPLGLHGYISANIAPAPQNYGYGVSFYTYVWPLLDRSLENFQVGLPSTWIIPNNKDDVQQPLCPPGTYAREHYQTRGPAYRSVFQTIEGGMGYWSSTQFNSLTPRFGIVGTPDCYTTTLASYNWNAGKNTVVPPNLMGIAQLSNRIIVPPEGLTFANGTNGKMVGFAWMALPISPNTTAPAPTGDQSWTLFINADNFAGPVVFFIPNNFSRLSQNYKVIVGRGLDARPAIMNGGSMEVNAVPFFQSEAMGTTYTRIPRLQFFVNEKNQSILMRDISYYSKEAIYTPLKNALNSNKAVPASFKINFDSVWNPTCKAIPLQFTQAKTPLTGFDNVVQTFAMQQDGKCVFGLQWKNANPGLTYFPNYFKQVGNARTVVPFNQVPDTANLKEQNFKLKTAASFSYQVPAISAWSHWVTAPIRVKLADGSTVEYRWYKFVEQPAFQHLNLTPAQKEALQNIAVKLQKTWDAQHTFMPAPSGSLVQMDNALLVTPPAGMEYGYVPIVVRQGR